MPEPLNLTESPWDVGLLLLSMPDAGFKLHELSDPDPADLIETKFLVNDRCLTTAEPDLTQVYPISDGVVLMKAMAQLVGLETEPGGPIRRHKLKGPVPGHLLLGRGRFDLGTNRTQVTFARKMGWLIKDDKEAWQLGPNLNYTL